MLCASVRREHWLDDPKLCGLWFPTRRTETRCAKNIRTACRVLTTRISRSLSVRSAMRYANLLVIPVVAAFGCAAPQPPQIVKMAPAIAYETWAPQDFATNVQDWDRAATRIADGLRSNGLLGGTEPHAFSVKPEQDSMFLRQLSGALKNQIISRGGPAFDMTIELTVDVVPWASRPGSAPYVPRREAVWQATAWAGGKVMSFREPMYIFESDVGLYVLLPPPPPSQGQVLASTARPLRYSTR